MSHDDPTQTPDHDQTLPPPDPGQLTRDTVDLESYYSPHDLAAMPQDALEELWQGCPEQPFYEGALREAIDSVYPGQIVNDLNRLDVIEECIALYQADPPRVPVARLTDGTTQWFQISGRVQEHLESGKPLERAAPQEKKGLPLPAIGALIAIGLVLLCIMFGLIRKASSSASEADMTATADAEALAALPLQETPTPTPLALENIDRPIKGGDDLRAYYPVMLEIEPTGQAARVFPVQQREVKIAEWQYENDPNVASSILGLVIRPVLGIPYSPDNNTFLQSLQAGDQVSLKMSTGRTLLFNITGSQRVDRQTTAIFDQSTPGIVIVLLGDPAGDRLVIYGDYSAGQETGSGGPVGGDEPLKPGQSAQHANGASIGVLDAYGSFGAGDAQLPPEWAYLLVDLEITTQEQPLSTGEFLIQAIDAGGTCYSPTSVSPSITNFLPFTSLYIDPGTTLRTTVAFLVPRNLAANNLTLRIQTGPSAPVTYLLDYTPPGTLTAANLDVTILSAVTEGNGQGELVIYLRMRYSTYTPNSSSSSPRSRACLVASLGVLYSATNRHSSAPLSCRLSVQLLGSTVSAHRFGTTATVI